jgi:peptidoglycan/xylan/chitin deacetylase (PgdA/CDA1 family)
MEDANRRRSPWRQLPLFAALFVSLVAPACGPAPVKAEHLSFGCRDARRIALTFDDGPNPPYTGQIIDILQSASARATFFDEGQAVEAHAELAKREVASGMTIGSHSYTHSGALSDLPRAGFADDLRQAEAAIVAAAGFTPGLYRAPFGHTSDSMLEELQRAGYVSVGWDLDSRDWSDATADEVVSNVLDHAHPGAIVLMHDGGLGGGNPDRSTTVAALPRILAGLREQGYELVTVPELTGAPAVNGAPRRPACSAS